MEIDIIIPLYKPGKELFTLLDKLENQSVPVHKIILLNTEEKYFTALTYGTDFVKRYRNVEVFHLSKREFDHGGTRRLGVSRSNIHQSPRAMRNTSNCWRNSLVCACPTSRAGA